MAASVKRKSFTRVKAFIKPLEGTSKDHPLHIFISKKDASILNIERDKRTFYLSVWTNTTTKFQNESKLQVQRPQTQQKSNIFQRMLSGSQNFPEILQPDSSDVDIEQKADSLIDQDIEIFVYCWVKDDMPRSTSGSVTLWCSEEFKSHYNIDSNVVYVREVTAYPVSSVTIGVSTHETFQWLTNSYFSKRLLTEVNSNTVLVRAKDVFLAPYGTFLEDPDFKRSFYFDMYVLECAPVQQGLIAESTEMILTYMGDLVAERQLFQAKIESILLSPDKGKKAIHRPFKDTLMSDFSLAMNQNINTPEISDKEDRNSLSFKMKADAIQKRRQQQKSNIVGQYLYEIVEQHSKFKRMLWRDNRKQNFDPLYYVGMSRKLMIKLGLFHSSYVLLTPVYYDDDDESIEDSKVQTVERLCMIKCLGKEYDKSKRLFISPLCLFNMIRKPPVEFPQHLLMKRYTGMGDHNYNMTSSQSWSAQIPEAREVHISIIPSPNYSPRSPHDEALKQYFNVPRIVSEGDVLAIRSSDDPQFWQNTGDDTENRFPCIYFKVVRAVGPTSSHQNFLLNKDTAKLIQIGTDHSYIPVMMQVYLNPTPQGFWDRDTLPGLSTYIDQLESFILPHLTSKHSCKSLSTVPPAILIAGPVGCGKTTLIVAVARRLGVHAFKINCHSLVGESSGATEARMKNAFTAAGLYSPCILLLQSIHAIGRDRDGSSDDPRVASSFLSNVLQLKNDLQQFPMIVVATTHSNKDLTHDMLECFLHQVCIEFALANDLVVGYTCFRKRVSHLVTYSSSNHSTQIDYILYRKSFRKAVNDVKVPTELDRADMFEGILQNVPYSGNLSIAYIAQRTAGFVLGDMAALVAHAKREAFRRVMQLCCSKRLCPTEEEEEDLLAAGIVLQQVDFQKALDQLQAAHSDAIGAPKIPNVTWDDVGGLMDIKSEILDTIQLPLQYPELLAAGLRRSGVLLYGPPGTGKTLLAKAVATECSLNFLSVKGPELINMYVGQSEENVREVFKRARSATPCVIFFDELDSLAPNRGKSGDSGGVMDRVVSQLLAELDGLNKASDVFVIGATNRPDLLDPALLRPGRFDKLLYLGVSEDNESQMRILYALTRKFNLPEDFDLDSIVEKCPFTLTGADFYALSSDAMLNAVKRRIQELDLGATTDQNVDVTEQDFLEALDKLTPSVSENELNRYRNIQEHFQVSGSPQKEKPKKQTNV